MNIENLTLKQFADFTQMLSGATGTSSSSIGSRGKHIVVLQRGWVLIGDLMKQGHDCVLTNASVIRHWGTTKGLGEIAENGKTDKTILDPTPQVSFNELTAILFIKCNESKWK